MAIRKNPTEKKPGGAGPGRAAAGGKPAKKVRYAVVGLGYYSQAAILPAFEHAGKNSELVALVSDDPEKRAKLGKKYHARSGCGYDEFDLLLDSKEIDAVYI